MDSKGLTRVTVVMCVLLGIGLSNGQLVKLNSRDDFEKKVVAEKNAWLIAGLESDLSASRHFEKHFMVQLDKLVGDWINVGTIQVEDLPKDMQKPNVEHLQKAAPLLWLVHRKTRTMKELLIPIDPDGTMHPHSILGELRRQLDLSKSIQGKKLKLGFQGDNEKEL
uniref:Uncharacterized protein n=1 Tax=Pyramimonas obovata TaxID=1411642 RepID=A0A7S0RNE6_9CHLO